MADAERSWNLALLTAAEPGRRHRRTVDAVLLVVGALTAGLAAVVAASAGAVDEETAEALVTVLGWAEMLWRAAFMAALLLAFAIVVDVLVRRRWALARDLLVALLLVIGVGLVLGRIVESDWLVIEADLWSQWGFPELRVACVAAIFAVAAPELVRPVRILAGWLVVLAAIGAVALGAALASGFLGALALGLGIAALVRLVFGTAAGFPPAETIRLALGELGVDVADLTAADRQRIGTAEYVGHDPRGRPQTVRVLGRDAQDTQRMARRWRSLAYRDPPRSVAVGRLEQVEHEALATLMAAQAGVRVPEVLTAALTPDGDALVVTRRPDIDTLEDAAGGQVEDELLQRLWEEVARLHAAGISHGRLNAANVLVVDGEPMLVDLSAATLGAPRSALDIDTAELLVASTVLVGADRALRAAVAGGGAEMVSGALPYLQRAALTPHVRDLARHQEVAIAELRSAAAVATGHDEPPDVAPLRRVRIKDVLLTGVLILAAYLLISQLAEIGFDTIADEIRTADPAWVIVALVLAQATFIPAGISLRGGVPTPLPLLPCVVLQSAIKFINLAVPSSAGRIGINLRFLQRMGAPPAEAVAAGAVDDISNTVVQVALFGVTLPLVHTDIDTGQFDVKGPDTRLVAAIVAAVLVSAVAVMSVPRLRNKVLPGIRSALAALGSVARIRRKRLELFGGTIGAELLYALALGATCLAYGVDLSLAELVFINTAASVLSSLVPVPGGIGAAEASLSAGLIAVGVDEPTAFAIAITQRLLTFYLPPIWGYVSLRWLTRSGYL